MQTLYLKINQFAVGKAKLSTGHVLKNDGSLFQQGDDEAEMYEIFDGLEQAKKFALVKINKNPEIECWINNYKGEHIITYDKDGERKFPNQRPSTSV